MCSCCRRRPPCHTFYHAYPAREPSREHIGPSPGFHMPAVPLWTTHNCRCGGWGPSLVLQRVPFQCEQSDVFSVSQRFDTTKENRQMTIFHTVAPSCARDSNTHTRTHPPKSLLDNTSAPAARVALTGSRAQHNHTRGVLRDGETPLTPTLRQRHALPLHKTRSCCTHAQAAELRAQARASTPLPHPRHHAVKIQRHTVVAIAAAPYNGNGSTRNDSKGDTSTQLAG